MAICKNKIDKQILELICEINDLTDFQKKILQNRYVDQVKFYLKKSNRYGFLYYTLNLIITIGSIFLPALLAIQNNDTYKEQIYWLTWIVSLIITISNGIIQLYSINTLYIVYNQVKEKLITEGWRYLQLSGKYKNKNHSLAFKDFCLKIEELKMKQVQKELEDMGNDNNEDDNFLGSTNSITANSTPITENLTPIIEHLTPIIEHLTPITENSTPITDSIINLNNLNNEKQNNIETNL
jgi:hypothetical protein